MPLTKELRALINQANALKSTGPKTVAGKQRSAMNACKHNLTGSSLILQPDEMESYNRLTNALLSDLKPKTEQERQAVQKIIDTNFRLNRLAGIENNMFNFGLLDNSTDGPNDDRIEAMVAQTRAWIERAGSFDVLGRYEARLTRQLLQFTLELERLQANRKNQEFRESLNPDETKRDKFNLASFGRATPELVKSVGSYSVLTGLPPLQTPKTPTELPAEPQIGDTRLRA